MYYWYYRRQFLSLIFKEILKHIMNLRLKFESFFLTGISSLNIKYTHKGCPCIQWNLFMFIVHYLYKKHNWEMSLTIANLFILLVIYFHLNSCNQNKKTKRKIEKMYKQIFKTFFNIKSNKTISLILTYSEVNFHYNFIFYWTGSYKAKNVCKVKKIFFRKIEKQK